MAEAFSLDVPFDFGDLGAVMLRLTARYSPETSERFDAGAERWLPGDAEEIETERVDLVVEGGEAVSLTIENLTRAIGFDFTRAFSEEIRTAGCEAIARRRERDHCSRPRRI